MREALASALRRAQSLLEERSGDLRNGADLLLKSETITPEDFPPIARHLGSEPPKASDPIPDSGGSKSNTPQKKELVA